jgi:hypothetical protein
MKNNDDIPTTDTTEIKQLINRIKQGELDRGEALWKRYMTSMEDKRPAVPDHDTSPQGYFSVNDGKRRAVEQMSHVCLFGPLHCAISEWRQRPPTNFGLKKLIVQGNLGLAAPDMLNNKRR